MIGSSGTPGDAGIPPKSPVPGAPRPSLPLMHVVLILSIAGMAARLVTFAELTGEDADLPCPWCKALTSEDDEACGACGRRFG